MIRALLFGSALAGAWVCLAPAQHATPGQEQALLVQAGSEPALAARLAALEQLARMGSPAAAECIDRLLETSQGEEQAAAARALAQQPLGRGLLVARVQVGYGATGAARSLGEAALAELLPAYGTRLAELSTTCPDPAAILPLARGVRDPSARLRLAARVGLDRLLARWVGLSREDLALEFLSRAGGLGFDRRDMAWRSALVSLSGARDAQRALQAATEISEVSRAEQDPAGRWWRFHGLYLRAAALLAEGRASEAQAALRDARELLEGLLRERAELRPDPLRPGERDIEIGGDRCELAGLVELLDGLALLMQGRPPLDRDVLERMRRVHLASLEAQLATARSGEKSGLGSLDNILDRDIAPRRLLFSNENSLRLPRGRALDLLLALDRALAAVARGEMPGFALELPQGLERRLGDPWADPERRQKLLEIQEARLVGLGRAIDNESVKQEPDRLGILMLGSERRELGKLIGEGKDELSNQGFIDPVGERDPASAERDEPGQDALPPQPAVPRTPALERLLECRQPSSAAYELALQLRAEGRAEEAVELCRRALADLERAGVGARSTWGSWSVARLQWQLGCDLTDAKHPEEAELELQAAEQRLQQLENSLGESRAQRRGDAQEVGALANNVRITRRMRADVLVSLAVNANVRLDDQEKALGYFERAYALDSSETMTVLLACYRARSGRSAEARAALAQVLVEPAHYYNLACTWALLGEKHKALELLERELKENALSGGAREKRRAWAREDPDLKGLRGDVRFEGLVGK